MLKKCGLLALIAVCPIILYKNHGRLTECHADVGGGSVDNGTRNSLARIPLRWMIRQCFLTNTGIMFHRSLFKQIGMDDATVYPHVVERPPAIFQTLPLPSAPSTTDGGTFVSEELEDLADTLCPVYDQLQIALWWWILEVIPQKLHYQRDEDDHWGNNFV